MGKRLTLHVRAADRCRAVRGIGTYGQFIFVSPRTKVVIVRTADEDGIDPPYWREVFQYIADQISEVGDRQETSGVSE